MLSFLQNFATWFALIEIVLAVVMIVLVLLQAKGSDMSALAGWRFQLQLPHQAWS